MKTIRDLVMSDIAGLTGLFVTGADTGVGNTRVAATLTRLLVSGARGRYRIKKILSAEENVHNVLIKCSA